MMKHTTKYFSLAIVTTMNTTVFAANDSGIPERRGVYIRECVGYEPNYTNIDYTHKLLGSVSGDNTQGSSPMQITYQYEQSGTAGVSYSIAPGKFEVLNVYIPAVRTAGRLKYKVYMDGYPENVFYEYKTLTESYAPQKNSVRYKVTTSSYSAIKVPKGMTVYTPTGVYKAQ